MPAGRSLKLIRDSDALSPSIRSAMNAVSVIPVVEMNTPSGVATLGNAKIVNIAPPATTNQLEVVSFSGSSLGGSGRVTLGEISVSIMRRKLRKGSGFEEIGLVFESITISHKNHKKSYSSHLSDVWSIPVSAPK
jgi:hypothetical protein